MPTILIVDDEPQARNLIKDIVTEEGYTTLEAENMVDAQRQIDSGLADIALLDVQLPDGNGLALLERLTREQPSVACIVMTAYNDIEIVIEAMQNGAKDFLTKPIRLERLLKALTRASQDLAIKRELAHWREQNRKEYTWVVGETPAMKHIAEMVERVASTQSPVLILGESGTGKEVIANAIHQQSPRKEQAFMPLNCATFNKELLESELFGHEAAAFTGATKRKAGLFEVAEGGTLFLDEISSMKPELQASLLRALEEKCIRRVGGTTYIKTDVRVIAATNHDLLKMIEQNLFREDLYWRLKVIEITLPPLRERREDIRALTAKFIEKFNTEMGKQVRGIQPRALEALQNHTWRGNIRELRGVIERAMSFCDGTEIQVGHLPPELITPHRN